MTLGAFAMLAALAASVVVGLMALGAKNIARRIGLV